MSDSTAARVEALRQEANQRFWDWHQKGDPLGLLDSRLAMMRMHWAIEDAARKGSETP